MARSRIREVLGAVSEQIMGLQGQNLGTRARRLLGGLSLLALVGCGASGDPFSPFPPSFRGIVVPLPPPSYADQQLVEIDLDGEVDDNPAGTRVMLYEYAQAKGWFTYPDDAGQYAFTAIPVDLSDNCLQLDVLEGGSDLLPTQLFKAELHDGDACLDDPWCSATDDLGACVCLVRRTDLTKCAGG